MKKIFSLFLVVIFFVSCSHGNGTYRKTDIYNKAKELLKIPEKHEKKKWPEGTIVAVEKGKLAPFSGILLSEERAKDAGELRIKYDYLYTISKVNSKFSVSVLDIANDQINNADKKINKLRDKNNSWWSRNKVSLGVVCGFVVGVTLSGVIVWGAFKISKK